MWANELMHIYLEKNDIHLIKFGCLNNGAPKTSRERSARQWWKGRSEHRAETQRGNWKITGN